MNIIYIVNLYYNIYCYILSTGYNMIYNEFQMRDVNFEIDFEGEREGKHESGIVLGTDERAGQH